MFQTGETASARTAGAQRVPLHEWQGNSGRWYVHSVLPIRAWSYFDSKNYIFARARADGLYDPIYIGHTDDWKPAAGDPRKLLPAMALGATHVHVHLPVASRLERLMIKADLCHRHWTPLNLQDATAGINGLPI